ncbi:MAG: hypothetical protein C0468_01630 [Planctomyces sp.]|nr:hypothetical protein [Planctomyces sp.]
MPTASHSWTSLIGLGLGLTLRRRVAYLSDLGARRRDAAQTQLAQLRALLRAARRTEFGLAHRFERLAALPDGDLLRAYQASLPPAEYAAFAGPLAQMRQHARPDVLWPGLVRHFAQTSGTTAGDKFIPVSKQMLRSNYRAALDIFAHAVRFGVRLPWLLGGKSLFLGGSTTLEVNEHGIATGDLSGLVTPLIRWPISEIYLPGPEIALMSHWPSKLRAMAARCLDQDVRMLNGMPSWALVLFERVLELARAAGRKADTIADVWPNLGLFVHGGVNYAPFDARVRTMLSGSPAGPDFAARVELYPASEGFIAIQDTPAKPGLRLLTDIGNFYEFIPLERIDDPAAPAFMCHQVDKGQRYVVCMSTCAGLWRYVIGDVVEFDSVPDAPAWATGTAARAGDGPPRLRIVGRHRHFMNAFGENLIVEHIENAAAAASRATGLMIGEFTAAPVYPGPGRRAGLELLLEVADPTPAPVNALAAFADAFDRSLKAQNVDYTTKRTDSVGMAGPTVTPMPIGAVHRWLASRGKLGGQHKVPRCANHRDYADALRGFALAGPATPAPPAGRV